MLGWFDLIPYGLFPLGSPGLSQQDLSGKSPSLCEASLIQQQQCLQQLLDSLVRLTSLTPFFVSFIKLT